MGWLDVTYNSRNYYPLLEVQSPMHRWDNTSYLQEAKNKIWPVMSFQTLNRDGDAIFNASSVNETIIGMGCLRATFRNNGSTSGASTLAGHDQQWMLGILLMAWGVWSFL